MAIESIAWAITSLTQKPLTEKSVARSLTCLPWYKLNSIDLDKNLVIEESPGKALRSALGLDCDSVVLIDSDTLFARPHRIHQELSQFDPQNSLFKDSNGLKLMYLQRSAIESLDIDNNLSDPNFLQNLKTLPFINEGDLVKVDEFEPDQLVYFFNTEGFSDLEHIQIEKPQQIICTASGLKPAFIANRSKADKNCDLIFVDQNPKAIQFYELLFNEWDGSDYPSFLHRCKNEFGISETNQLGVNATTTTEREKETSASDTESAAYDTEQLWKNTIDQFGGADEFKSNWRRMKEMKKRFVQIDLVESHNELIKIASGESVIAWLSNAFFTLYSQNRGILDTSEKFIALVNGICRSGRQVELLGEDPFANKLHTMKHNYTQRTQEICDVIRRRSKL